MFPALAGVSPTPSICARNRRCVPRTRGGERRHAVVHDVVFTRGGEPRYASKSGVVFPALAGVSPER